MNQSPQSTERTEETQKNLETLKTITGIVYLCQVLAFALAGLPLLIGVAVNFWKRKEVAGTWLESHFNWQIKTFWMTFLLLAVAGFTAQFSIGIIVLTIAVLVLGYRIALGWFALSSNKPIQEKSFT